MSKAARSITKILGRAGAVLLGLVVLLVAYVGLRWDAPDGRPTPRLAALADSATIAHGEYLYKFQAQCWGCHQSPSRDANAPPTGGLLFLDAVAFFFSLSVPPHPGSPALKRLAGKLHRQRLSGGHSG